MPTTQTSNAIGTARQFTQQPPQTYQRQLILPHFGENVRASETTQGAALARSLGVLSAAVEQYRVDYDKRQREIADKVVPILYGQNDHDTRLTMNSIAMLQQAGIGDLQDNPYALAMVDQLRGQEISSEVHKKYEAYVSQMKLPENLGKEIQNYDDFFNENVQKYLDNITVNNKYALNNGLYESRVVNTGKVASKFIAEKTEEMSINRSESIASFVSENTRNRWNWTDEDRENFANQLGNMLTTTQERDPTKNYQILQNMLKTVAMNTGDYSLIQKIGETPLYGGATKVSDYINVEQFKDVANESNRTHWMQRTRDVYDKMSKAKDKKSLFAIVDGLENPEDKQIAAEFVSGRLSAIEAEERAQRNIARAAAASATKAQVGNMNMKAQIEAVMNGQTQDAMGNGIATSSEQYKALGFTEAQLVLAVNDAYNGLDLSKPEDLSKMMRLAYHPAFHNFLVRSYTLNATAGINSLTVNGEMSPMLQRVVDLYQQSPGMCNSLLSDDTLKASIACIANEGVDKFMAVRNILSDSEQLKQVDTDLAPYIEDSLSGSSLPPLAGGDTYEGFSYGEPNSGDLKSLFKSHARVYRAMGASADEACMKAREAIASEFYVFNGAPIPKSIVRLVDIGGTDEDTARSAFYWVLASRFKEYCGSTVYPDSVRVSYVAGNASGNSMFLFVGPNGSTQVALNDIVSEAKANLEQSGNQTYDAPEEETSSQDDNTSTYQYTETSQYVDPGDSSWQSDVGNFISNLFG